jgi:UDP-glucose 4-epimerase
MSKRILVTGAVGFLGRAVCEGLQKNGHIVFRTYRASVGKRLDGDLVCDLKEISDIDISSRQIDVVIHCSAKVPSSVRHISRYMQENVYCTETLVKAAVKSGVKRIIFISSLSVYEGVVNSGHVTVATQPKPKSSYSMSKLEAENIIISCAEKSNLEVVIIRPPLIYGPGVKGNFKYLIKWIGMSLPLPFGNFVQPRSFVSSYNLVSLVLACINHEKASGNIFLVSDDDDVSMARVAEVVGFAINKKAILISVPVNLLRLLFYVFGRQNTFERINHSLQVDISHTKRVLGWAPRKSFEQSVKEMLDL